MTFLENAKVRIQWMHIFSTKVSTKGKIDQLWISWLVGKEHLTVGSSKITRLNYRNFHMSNIEFQYDLQKVNASNKRRMVLCWYTAFMLSRVSAQSWIILMKIRFFAAEENEFLTYRESWVTASRRQSGLYITKIHYV